MKPSRRTLLLILLIFVSGVGAGCQNEELLEAQLEKVAEASRQIEALKSEHQRSLDDLKRALERAQAEIDPIEERTRKTATATDQAKHSLEQLAESFAAYRHRYRTHVRATISEVSFPRVITPDGETLENLTVVAIESGELRYRSRNGIGKLPMETLPPALASALHLDEEAADRAAFPTIALPRESDEKPADDVIDLEVITLLAQEKAETYQDRQYLRNRRADASKTLEERVDKLANVARSLSAQREALKAQRNRHREYNAYHHVRKRDPDIARIDASIEKIDLRALAVRKRISDLRALMRKLR